jgi:predicted secreted Zn-dependent protease
MKSSLPPILGDFSWRVARKCNAGNCVRVAASGDMIVIGDSKSPEGPVLTYSHSEWNTFVEGVRQGDFDDLT